MKRYLIFILPLLLIVFGCGQENKNEKTKFNHEEWLQGDWRTRGKMVDNIIEDSILIGKSKLEVLQFLGDDDQGDTSDYFRYRVDVGSKTGPFGLGGMWPFDLYIYFDTLTNKVYEVRCND